MNGDAVTAVSILNIRFPFMHESEPRQRVNYRTCELCQNPFLADSSGDGACGRPLCRAVKVAWAKMAEAEMTRAMLPVA